MNFTKPILEIIRERTSSRTYSGVSLDENIKEKIKELLESLELKSPFNSQEGNIRFELINVPEFNPNEKKKLGTYGIIKGAQNFIVGAVKKFQFNREHFGFLMEKIILHATDMGLGTCWLGGTFNRSLFSTKIHKKEDEIVPAITPIGFSVKRTIKEKVIRRFIKANNRLLWNQLFFKHDFNTPVHPEEIPDYKELLEMVRIGPSAGNKQPWRIIRDTERKNFNFYIVKETGSYNQFPPLDIGIAVCHFDLTAMDLGINGNWIFSEPQIPRTENYKYIISWSI